MKTRPLRVCPEGTLVVTDEGVFKLKVDFGNSLPQNLLAIALTHQVTGETEERDIPWDTHALTEDPYTVEIRDGGSVTVELAQEQDDEGRPRYRHRVVDQDGTVLEDKLGIGLGVGDRPDNKKAAKTVLGFLSAAAEAQQSVDRGRESENSDLFEPQTMTWSAEFSTEIQCAELDLSGGMGL